MKIIGKLTSAFRAVVPSLPAIARPHIVKTYNTPPTPTTDYPIIVDRFCRPVTLRAPRNDDFLARPPVQFTYGGTIPKFNPANHIGRNEKSAAAMTYIAADARNKTHLEYAVLLLSQTNDGRRLLQMANREKFTFVFDDERMKNEGAVGLCDYQNKLIPLAAGRSAEEVALTLKHELQHMEDILKGISYNHTHTLQSSLMADRALEANARVSEAVACAQILHGTLNGPERQFKSTALFAAFFNKNTPMAARAQTSLELAEKGQWQEFANQVFDGYFEQQDTLDYYDKRQVDMYAKRLVGDPDKAFDQYSPEYQVHRDYYRTKQSMVNLGKSQLKDIASQGYWATQPDKLKSLVTICGRGPYLSNNKDLSHPRYTGFGRSAKESILSFIEKTSRFIPDRKTELEISLSCNERDGKQTRPTMSPYKKAAYEEEFKPIAHPTIISGENEKSTRRTIMANLFAEHYKRGCRR